MNNHERQKVPLGYVNKLGHYSLGHGLAKCSPWAKFGPHLFFFLWLHWDFIAALRFSLVVANRGCSLAVVHRLLIAVASLVAEQGL